MRVAVSNECVSDQFLSFGEHRWSCVVRSAVALSWPSTRRNVSAVSIRSAAVSPLWTRSLFSLSLWSCCMQSQLSPFKLHTAAAVAVYYTELVYSLGCSPSLHSWTLACSHTSVCNRRLPYNGLRPIIHVITWINTHLSWGMEGWVDLFGWHIVGSLRTKWSPPRP